MKTSIFPIAVTFMFLIVLLSNCSSPDEAILPIEPLPLKAKLNNDKQVEVMKIEFTENNLFPEGVEYDRFGKRFLVSSITQGSIGIVSAYGDYTEWINDPDIPSTIGLHIDLPRKRLLVAVADLDASIKSTDETIFSLAGLAAYDLRTGERLFFTRMDALLPGLPHFANDVTTDNRGNAYVTDSFTGVIYKVDTKGNASIFYQSEELDPAPESFGLNGIVYDPRGYLIASKLDEGKLLRFPINNPAAYTTIDVPVTLANPDGLYLKNNKELVVVNNAFAFGVESANVVTLSSKDKWASTQLVSTFNTGSVFPTTATVQPGGDVFVLYAYLHVLLSGGNQSQFQIVQVNPKLAMK